MAAVAARCFRRQFSFRFLSTTAYQRAQIEDTHNKSKSVIPGASIEEGSLNLVAGIPVEQTENRKVTIYLPSRNAMQSGTHNMRKWTISFDTQSRWENPLMGWGSTADLLSNSQIKFSTREAAISYCKSYGWDFEVVEPTLPKTRPKSYGANYAWNKRTRTSTK